MTEFLVVLAILCWLAVGWLPSRVMKHYFVTRFYDSLGKEAWGIHEECVVLLLSIGGLLGVVFTLLARWTFRSDDEKIPWGWMW